MFNGLRKFILPLALIYWISPIDLLPLFPADDILVLAAAALAHFMTANNRGVDSNDFRHNSNQEEDVITTSWTVVEDE